MLNDMRNILLKAMITMFLRCWNTFQTKRIHLKRTIVLIHEVLIWIKHSVCDGGFVFSEHQKI